MSIYSCYGDFLGPCTALLIFKLILIAEFVQLKYDNSKKIITFAPMMSAL